MKVKNKGKGIIILAKVLYLQVNGIKIKKFKGN
jgi:hypothetical protein